MKRGIATFTLDTGKCPPWLFERMVRLGRAMTEVLIDEYGPDEYIKRIADPVWFQSLGTVLAFDWNASGLTTILTAALKEGIRGQEKDLGIFIAGGKGATSRKTPDQIIEWGSRLNFSQNQTQGLVYSSKMSAKVDSSLVQDGYTLYHHSFFFSKNGAWTVVQQGMNTLNSTARRYHWYCDNPSDLNFTVEPHKGIASQIFRNQTRNLVSKKSKKNKDISIELVEGGYKMLMKDIELLRKHSGAVSRMVSFKQKQSHSVLASQGHALEGYGQQEFVFAEFDNAEFRHHAVEMEDFTKSKYLEKILQRVTYETPQDFESLLSIKGVGGKTIRALSLVSEIIYGAGPSYEDPARYSFAHGGKDATPYPVDRETYDKTIQVMQTAVRKAKIDPIEKDKALRRINKQTT
ncbi:MAG: DUF763 domain-containing protein [Candidatus Levybacteria bacterium CG10_big_fil_rev_8_21_14_0_10_35_13]|nr:MAG: DUF763 domain-containing protein [Candidatus Levybacteria bacterium CG10_big_fil_rev_8_21_14_0_10_35_13]